MDHFTNRHTIARLAQRRLASTSDFTAPAEPSDEGLRAYLNSHAAAFAVEPRFTFRQVYFDPQRRGGNLTRDVSRLLTEKRLGHDRADPAERSDTLLLAHEFESVSAAEAAQAFVDTFVAALSTRAPGQWQGLAPACIWSMSASASRGALLNWQICAMGSAASEPMLGGWRRARLRSEPPGTLYCDHRTTAAPDEEKKVVKVRQ